MKTQGSKRKHTGIFCIYSKRVTGFLNDSHGAFINIFLASTQILLIKLQFLYKDHSLLFVGVGKHNSYSVLINDKRLFLPGIVYFWKESRHDEWKNKQSQ